jgi:hypothetical protein
MIEMDIDRETLDNLGLRRADEEQWFPRDWTAFKRGLAATVRREQEERIAKWLAVVKAAREAGLPVKRVTIDGIEIEFGEADAPKATLTPLEAWEEKKRARSA